MTRIDEYVYRIADAIADGHRRADRATVHLDVADALARLVDAAAARARERLPEPEPEHPTMMHTGDGLTLYHSEAEDSAAEHAFLRCGQELRFQFRGWQIIVTPGADPWKDEPTTIIMDTSGG